MSKSENPLQVVDVSIVTPESASELLQAATSQGFLFIEGHGFSTKEVDELFNLSQKFFDKPTEYKAKHPIDGSNRGYTGCGVENLDPEVQTKGDPKEAYNFAKIDFDTGAPILTSEYPEVPEIFLQDENLDKLKNANLKLFGLTLRILKLLGISLKIEDTVDKDGNVVQGEDWFVKRHIPNNPSGTTLRFLHYPGQTSLNPEAVIRAGAHTDYGGMTLLFQRENQEGLEIHSPVSRKWEAVPFVASRKSGEAPPIIVNIADQLSYWTNGLLKSTIHRVKFPASVQESGQDRYSIVFFSHPNDVTLLEPVPSEVTRKILGRGANAAKKVLTAREYLDNRLAATYNWY